MYVDRTLCSKIAKVSQSFKVVMLTGMRQVGKTTLLKHLAQGSQRTYVTLDNPKDLLLAKTDPELFFQTYPFPLLIDEIQYAPELFPHIKMRVDTSSEKGQVWMTGSQQFLLMKGISESLAGRIALLDLLGYSIYERAQIAKQQNPFIPCPTPTMILPPHSLKKTFEMIWQGSYPGVVALENSEWADFYHAYVQTYIERDVRQLSAIGDTLSFLKFIKVLAARTAQELNLADVARNVDIAPNTAKNWLSILEASGVVYLLQPYFTNISQRVIKKPKLYFLDTGLCAYLSEWNTPEALATGAMNGPFFETFVFSEILKSYLHNGKHPSFYFYRDNHQREIDLLIAENGMLYQIEIKRTGSPTPEMIRTFESISFPNMEKGYGSLICLTDRPRPLTRHAHAISLWNL